MAFMRSLFLALLYLTGSVTLTCSLFPNVSFADPGPGGGDDPEDDEPEDDDLEDDEPEDDIEDDDPEDDIEDDEPEDDIEDDEPEDDEPEDDIEDDEPEDDEPEDDEPEDDEPEDDEPEDDEPVDDEPEDDEPEDDSGSDDEDPEEDESEDDSGSDDEDPEEDESEDDSGSDDEDPEDEEEDTGGSGNDDEGEDDDEDNSGSGNDDDDVEDNSGSGNDDDDDNSGSGSSNSGSGSSDDDEDNSGSGSSNSGSGSNGSDDDDDNSGSGSSNSGSGSTRGGSASSGAGTNSANLGTGSNEQSAESFAAAQDDDGNLAVLGEWLILVNPKELNSLSSRGYTANEITYLGGLDKMLARIEAPAGYNFRRVQRDIASFSPSSQVDYNHLYGTKSGKGRIKGSGIEPRAALNIAPENLGAKLKIGMIDTGILANHSVFAKAHLNTQDFVSYQFQRPKHGTSVASILVGESTSYHGLVPNAELYAASVFFKSPTGGERATTENLVQALDWMVENDVKIINMSLAGPANAVLEAAIKRAQAKGAIIIAAVGNDGPTAKPLYPAGYKDVIAVTAVNADNNIYRLANRGPHVDFAAPGVAIRSAAGNGQYQTSSGTSFAAPFAAVILAATNAKYQKPTKQIISDLQKNAVDLGAKGYDTIYGYGLIKPLPNPQK